MKKQIVFLIAITSFFFTPPSGVGGLFAQTYTDEAAIKAVIEKETQAWSNRDGVAMAACWANVPYAMQLVQHGNTQFDKNGMSYANNNKMDMVTAIPAMVASAGAATGETFQNSNYVMRVNGTSAFVHYDQVETAKDSSKQYAREVRYLEKLDGVWKIVYVGAVFHKP